MANDTHVTLRPVELRDLEVLAAIDTDPANSEPFEWRGFRDPQERRRRWERDGYLGTDESTLVLSSRDGTLVGIVDWRAVRSSGPVACFEIGILLLPGYHGRGIGTIGHRLLCDYLFATTTVNRLEALTEIDNLAEQRALEKAGFTPEGVLRGRAFVRGEYRDGVIFGRLRDDPYPSDR